MINLTNLVIQYKKNKDKLILDKIYLELKSTVKQKARYIFFAKWYPMNLYHKCKFCRNCDKLNDVPKREHNLICKECNLCKCIKGFFNLKRNNLCEYEDIENDIWVEVLRIIVNFDVTKDFNVYLFSCLWEFAPTFITKDYIKSLLNKSLIKSNNEEIEIDAPEEIEKLNLSMEEILKVAETKREKEIINLFLNDRKMTQDKAGKILGITHQAISLVLYKLQKRINKLK
jgi:hypothetical protein